MRKVQQSVTTIIQNTRLENEAGGRRRILSGKFRSNFLVQENISVFVSRDYLKMVILICKAHNFIKFREAYFGRFINGRKHLDINIFLLSIKYRCTSVSFLLRQSISTLSWVL
jgi:hypothetical protein